MLSRIVLKGSLASRLSLSSTSQVRLCTSQVQKSDADKKKIFGNFQEGPERDLVNFPRPIRPDYPGKVKLGFIPAEWFDAFYNKTGVTGPYIFTGGLVTYLFSKEIWVMEHEFYAGCSLFLVLYFLVKKVGPSFTAYIDKELDAEDKMFKDFRENAVNSVHQAINNEEKSQWMAKGEKMLFDAKKENVQLQVEAEYRQRLMDVYTRVKRRLDYQIEVQNSKKRIEQGHMVNWITDSVVKSITPQQEKESLQKCFADLKTLAAKA